jgi:hypothetical protein
MVLDVDEGDVVLHYHSPDRAFTHWSRAVGDAYEDELLWGRAWLRQRPRAGRPLRPRRMASAA